MAGVPWPMPVRGAQRAIERLAGDSRTAALEPVVERLAGALDSRPRLRQALDGGWLGHAVHPMLTDFTAGPWMAASLLDLFGPAGSRDAARRLVGFGLLAAVPTLASGLVDWSATREDDDRRAGVVHAATASVATLLYAGSWLARRRGSHRLGAVLALTGGSLEMFDGYVGGELSLVARVGTGRRPATPEATRAAAVTPPGRQG